MGEIGGAAVHTDRGYTHTQLFLHALHAVKTGSQAVVVIAKYTDMSC